MENNKLSMVGTYVLAILAGICLSASYTTLFYSTIVSFSIFPVIALVLSIYCLHQRYLAEPMPHGTATTAILSCLLGFFSYNVIIRAEYPELGNNLLQTFITMGLLFWIFRRLKALNHMPGNALQKE